MIGSALAELEKTELLQLFGPSQDGVRRPLNPRLEGVELRLLVDRKGLCNKAQLKLQQGLLKHPVLEGPARELVERFLGQALPQRPDSSRVPAWLSQSEKFQEKAGQLTLSRETVEGFTVVAVSSGGSFLKSLFGR